MDYGDATSRSLRRLVGSIAAAVVLVSGCGTSVATSSHGASGATPSDGASGHPTTVPSPISIRDLERLLPTVADVGDGYRVDQSASGSHNATASDHQGDVALTKACPAVAPFIDEHIGDRPSADRTFVADGGRIVEVNLEPDATLFPSVKKGAELDALIAAVEGCGTISFPGSGGTRNHVVFKLDKIKSPGGVGIDVRIQYRVSGGQLPRPIVLRIGIRRFLVGTTGVTVTVESGLDQDTLREIPGDFDRIDPLSTKMERGIESLHH